MFPRNRFVDIFEPRRVHNFDWSSAKRVTLWMYTVLMLVYSILKITRDPYVVATVSATQHVDVIGFHTKSMSEFFGEGR